MALVSNDPGGTSGALGVITLEDVIEELIGEVNMGPIISCGSKYAHLLFFYAGNH